MGLVKLINEMECFRYQPKIELVSKEEKCGIPSGEFGGKSLSLLLSFRTST